MNINKSMLYRLQPGYILRRTYRRNTIMFIWVLAVVILSFIKHLSEACRIEKEEKAESKEEKFLKRLVDKGIRLALLHRY